MIAELVGFSSIGMAFFVCIVSMTMARRYKKTKAIGRSFLYLGLAFACYGVAETLWYSLDYYEIEPYQNYPDLFYIGYYGFAMMHIIETIRFFKVNKNTLSQWEILLIGGLVLSVVTVFVFLAWNTEMDDILYALPFIVMASVLGGLAFVGMIRVFSTDLSTTWVFIGTAIMLASVMDVQYYALETLFGYDYWMYPAIDATWFATDITMVIGIILHRRKI